MRISPGIDQFAAWLPVKPAVYFWMFVVWGVTLWFLSAGNPGAEHAPKIPHFDKLLHFTYFLGGGSALAACIGLKWPDLKPWSVFLTTAAVCCIVGRLDEYHQSFTPGRSGNDHGDWLADILGGIAGAWLVVAVLLPRWKKIVEKPGRKAA